MNKTSGLHYWRPLFLYIITIPFCVSIIGAILLYAVSFIPTQIIQDHALSSAYQLYDEGWPRDFYSIAGGLEFHRGTTPDSVSVMTAYTLDRQHSDNVFLKKVYSNPNVLGWYRRLVETVEGREVDTVSYSRYWMGFRIPIRLLLIVTAFHGIRFLAAALDFVLLIAACATISKRGSAWTAIALACSIGLLEPYAIIGTLSYSTCFILLFLLIIWANILDLSLSDKETILLFCLFGSLTQFFDFYTYPLLVCALPLLVLIQRYQGKKILKYAGRLCIAWFLSWILTWLINLLFVTVLTNENGFLDAFHSVAFRFGLGEYRDETTSYSIREAFQIVWEYLKLPNPKWVIPSLIVCIVVLFLFARKYTGRSEKMVSYLAVCVLPLLWIAATAQPIIIHTDMQYRNVGILYFALFLYVMESIGVLSGESKLINRIWKAKENGS